MQKIVNHSFGIWYLFLGRCFELGLKWIQQACAQARWNKNSIFALAFKIPADVGIV